MPTQPYGASDLAYVVNSGSDNISIIDIPSRTVVATVSVGAGPFAAAVSHDKALLYVTNTSSNRALDAFEGATTVGAGAFTIGEGSQG